jgi:predicted 3-demethylubiquinone-9 3-methyltransferase (glyoxalase superfamily)
MPVQPKNDQKLLPFLLFKKGAEDAAKYYTSVFKNSSIINTNPMATTFELEGMRFVALNGPDVEPTEATSFYIDCADQAEVDYFWNKFVGDGGEESQCGWCKDKYGFAWQVIPKKLIQLMNDKDQDKANRAMQAMLKMKKIIVADLEKAAKG